MPANNPTRPATPGDSGAERLRHFALAIVAGIGAIVSAGDVRATVPRTFVASYGVDANPCSRTKPCRSFGSAIAQTDDAGEVIALDSGGYGKVTIANSVTISAPAGVHAGISVTSGNDGVTVNGQGIMVVLRGLLINGQSGANAGINLVSGSGLLVERCSISGMGLALTATLDVDTLLQVHDSTFAENGDGLVVHGPGAATLSGVQIVGNDGNGVLFADGVDFRLRNTLIARNGGNGIGISGLVSGKVVMSIERTQIFANGSQGIEMTITAIQTATLLISDSEIARNNRFTLSGTGGVFLNASASVSGVSLTRTTVDGNGGDGILADSQFTFAILDESTVTGNGGSGIFAANGGTIYTRGNNIFHHNSAGDQGGNIVSLAAH